MSRDKNGQTRFSPVFSSPRALLLPSQLVEGDIKKERELEYGHYIAPSWASQLCAEHLHREDNLTNEGEEVITI
jgi:hypothetical protein